MDDNATERSYAFNFHSFDAFWNMCHISDSRIGFWLLTNEPIFGFFAKDQVLKYNRTCVNDSIKQRIFELVVFYPFLSYIIKYVH